MFTHILVPLDGSHLAECVIPVVTELAKATGARVTLIHMIEENPPQTVHGDHHIVTEEEAHQYLEVIAKTITKEGIATQTHVHSSCIENVAESIVNHAEEIHHDLIVLCTHGESGWMDRIVGSIAQQVIGMGKIPVLLLQPEGTTIVKTHYQKFLLALDGDEEHEIGVEKSVDLAKLLNANIHLLTVIETYTTLSGTEAATGILLPSATSAMLDLAEEEAQERLEEKAVELQKKGFIVSFDVHRGDPVQWIVKDANTHNCDLIVLGTHGKSGTKAFWAGSSAPRIPGQTPIALLLVPVHHAL
jgi:nucleotide-binding universal stress UspA family protein